MASLSGFPSFRAPAVAAARPPPRPLVPWPRFAAARPYSAARQTTRLSARSSTVTAAGASSREPSPLQRTLEAEGVADWAAYDTPYLYGTLGNAPGLGHLAAKIKELSREGLAAADVERLFQQHDSPVPCDLEAVFCPNLAYLRALLADVPNVPKRREPAGLTALGRLLRDQPSAMARLLSQTPTRLDELDRWVCDELGVEREELAGAVLKTPTILCLPVANGRMVAGFLSGELGLKQKQVVRMLIAQPRVFFLQPDRLREKVSKLKAALAVEQDSIIVSLVLEMPRILVSSLDDLPAVLVEIDNLFGRQGAGAELVLRSPVVAVLTVERVVGTVQALRGLGLSENRTRKEVGSDPTLLGCDLEGADQQQKLAWAAAHGVSLSEFFASSAFGKSLRRMASRYAFMCHLDLAGCIAVSSMAKSGEPRFLLLLSRRAGREVTPAEFEAFVAGWLESPEGQRWGLKPEKARPPPKPRGRARGRA